MDEKRRVLDITHYRIIPHVTDVETLLCYATLVAHGKFNQNEENVNGAVEKHFKNIGEDCGACSFFNRCLAVMITE